MLQSALKLQPSSALPGVTVLFEALSVLVTVAAVRARALFSGQALTRVLHGTWGAEAAVHAAGVCAHLVGVLTRQRARAPALLENLAASTHHGWKADDTWMDR